MTSIIQVVDHGNKLESWVPKLTLTNPTYSENMSGLSLYPFQLDKTATTSFTANEQHLAYVEAIFGCSDLVFPRGITSVILPFSFRWDVDLVTHGDMAAGTAAGCELIFFL